MRIEGKCIQAAKKQVRKILSYSPVMWANLGPLSHLFARSTPSLQRRLLRTISSQTLAALGHSMSQPKRRTYSPYHYLLLTAITVICLSPFSGRAFHVDDTLFVWAAKHIAKQPMDPYGFDLIWNTGRVPMAEVTENPPLASYYPSLAGRVGGWSERALHLAFLVPAVIVVLATFRLSRRFTDSPLLAALGALLTPGFIVSALSVMCDVTMLAMWMLATVFWIEGEDDGKPTYLVISGFLVGVAALTKYFGIALIPLLLVYSTVRKRQPSARHLLLLIPIALLAMYQVWTAGVYGEGLLSRAASFAQVQRESFQISLLASSLVAASFTGGCALTVLFLSWSWWSKKFLLVCGTLSVGASALILSGWTGVGLQVGGPSALAVRREHWILIGGQLALCILGGIATLVLAITDFWRHRDGHSLFLMLWVVGTFIFAGFFNWTVNARSVLPLIPATGILLARRIGHLAAGPNRRTVQVGAALLASAAISLWIAAGDTKLANTARLAATKICGFAAQEHSKLHFTGHWGFQYYMEACAAQPVDFSKPEILPGDLVAVPDNNTDTGRVPPERVASTDIIEFRISTGATTINTQEGAGFYSAAWGPLPFALGPVPSERYELTRTR